MGFSGCYDADHFRLQVGLKVQNEERTDINVMTKYRSNELSFDDLDNGN